MLNIRQAIAQRRVDQIAATKEAIALNEEFMEKLSPVERDAKILEVINNSIAFLNQQQR